MVQYFHILTRGKYCNRNNPDPQYFPLLEDFGVLYLLIVEH